MEELIMHELTNKYTRVYHEISYPFHAPSKFRVEDVDGNCVGEVNFQSGLIKESGINGVMNEDVLCMVLKRLECFQDSEFKCRENAAAVKHIKKALKALRKRTEKREKRGVEGTHKV